MVCSCPRNPSHEESGFSGDIKRVLIAGVFFIFLLRLNELSYAVGLACFVPELNRCATKLIIWISTCHILCLHSETGATAVSRREQGYEVRKDVRTIAGSRIPTMGTLFKNDGIA